MLFGVLALVVLVGLVYFRQTETPPKTGTAYPPVAESTPAQSETPGSSPLAALSPADTQTTTTQSSVVSYAKELVWKYLGEPRYDVFAITRAANAGDGVWGVFGQFTYAGSTARNFDAIVEKQENGAWWLQNFSWRASTAPAPAPSETLGASPRTTPSPTATQTTTTQASAVDHAKVLVWKYLGEPRYDVLTITRASNTIANIWDVSGRFAHVGSPAQTFDAIIEKQPNGDWWLLAFSWT